MNRWHAFKPKAVTGYKALAWSRAILKSLCAGIFAYICLLNHLNTLFNDGDYVITDLACAAFIAPIMRIAFIATIYRSFQDLQKVREIEKELEYRRMRLKCISKLENRQHNPHARIRPEDYVMPS